jgi:hypothetical protein
VQSVKEFSLEVLVSKTKFGDVVQDCRPVLCCVCIASVKWPTQVAVGMAFSPKMLHDSHDTCCVTNNLKLDQFRTSAHVDLFDFWFGIRKRTLTSA